MCIQYLHGDCTVLKNKIWPTLADTKEQEQFAHLYDLSKDCFHISAGNIFKCSVSPLVSFNPADRKAPDSHFTFCLFSTVATK